MDDDAWEKLGVWAQLQHMDGQVKTEIGRRLEAAFGTSLLEHELLAALLPHPDGLRMHELADALLVTRGGVTRLIDRLVGKGLVERHPEPGNRRVILAVLTDKGRRQTAEAKDLQCAIYDELIGSRLDGQDIAALRRILGKTSRPHPPEADQAASSRGDFPVRE
ncbi:DNA-binding MarR family transcriptional regulator [Thermocatellispora tengchongensis]|uniref:DNA-binding MarR family transcriptional regulator n=1 Tax=Thermocatellispora tengchongensis TaxID=1073253 RepID=A0A840NYN8_9ACTN|nr:MarR family transcriptional regulator [Thermocatellispora tengchongensis]MBB5132608.1 DNA-binding MarR family transcriptional regulator [Thermocatellispora tengchongensis]